MRKRFLNCAVVVCFVLLCCVGASFQRGSEKHNLSVILPEQAIFVPEEIESDIVPEETEADNVLEETESDIVPEEEQNTFFFPQDVHSKQYNLRTSFFWDNGNVPEVAEVVVAEIGRGENGVLYSVKININADFPEKYSL